MLWMCLCLLVCACACLFICLCVVPKVWTAREMTSPPLRTKTQTGGLDQLDDCCGGGGDVGGVLQNPNIPTTTTTPSSMRPHRPHRCADKCICTRRSAARQQHGRQKGLAGALIFGPKGFLIFWGGRRLMQIYVKL